MKKSVLTILTLAVLTAGCASYSRLGQYPAKSEAVKVGNTVFRVYHHPDENVLLVQSPFLSGIGAAAISGLTFGTINSEEVIGGSPAVWEQAAVNYLNNESCKINRFYRLSEQAWEAVYECDPPDGSEVP